MEEKIMQLEAEADVSRAPYRNTQSTYTNPVDVEKQFKVDQQLQALKTNWATDPKMKQAALLKNNCSLSKQYDIL